MELPLNFTDYSEAKKAGFMKMKELKENGANVVGTFCTYTPTELVLAAGGICVGLCGLDEDPIRLAETKLPKNLCPLIKSSYGHALGDTCPYFYFSDMILAETTCDGKKKMFELMNDIKHTHVMQLPPGKEGKGAFNLWREEIVTLKEVLEEKFNVEITEEDLKNAIKLKNRERKVILEYFELGKLNPPPLGGFEQSTLIDSISFVFNMEDRIKIIEDRIVELRQKYEREKDTPSTRPRIIVTGCPTGGVRDKVIKTIEDLGADVVGIDNCSGPREKRELVREDIDPIDALAEKYLNINCSVMSPNPTRYEALGEMIDDYNVDGVIEVVLQACHTFNVESYYIKEYVNNEKELPYLMIETDYSKSDVGQVNTRISAFLEMI